MRVLSNCKLGEVMSQVTHEYKGSMETAGRMVPLPFYVMNGRSSQGIVLGYIFLFKQKACTNFGSREIKLGNTEVSCLKLEINPMLVKTKKNAREPKEVNGKYVVYCCTRQIILADVAAQVALGSSCKS